MRIEVLPIFEVYIGLDKFRNVELHNRGYYQIRLSPKPSTDFSIDFRCESGNEQKLGDSLLPSSVNDGIGISRTIELIFADETLQINDVFILSIQALTRPWIELFSLKVGVELWFADRDRPPANENFTMISRRTLEIDLSVKKAHCIFRPINFEFFAFSSLTLFASSSLVSMLARRKKNPPDPGISLKLQQFHLQTARALLMSINSLERLIAANKDLLKTTIHIAETSVEKELTRLCEGIENSSSPWCQLESDAVRLSARLTAIHSQFVNLFTKNYAFMEKIGRSFEDWRWRRIGELFFFTEHSTTEIGSETLHNSTTITHIHSLVVSSPYFRDFIHPPLYLPNLDAPPQLSPIIFEQRFLPSVSGENSPSSEGPTIIPRLKPKSEASPLIKVARELRSFRLRRKSLSDVKKLAVNGERRGSAGELIVTQQATVHPITSNSSLSNFETIAREENGTSEAATHSNWEMESILPVLEKRLVLREKLRLTYNYDFCIYSEAANHFRPPPQCHPNRLPDRATLLAQSPHLIVFVHGLEGAMDDLMPYKNFLRISLPAQPMLFLMSRSNELETWADLEQMGANLLDEVTEYAQSMPRAPNRISFITHSLGGIIVRTAIGRSDAEWLREKAHTLLTLNTPHLGLIYAPKVSSFGVAVIQWWKKSRSLEQLAMKDSTSLHDSFLMKLSKNKSLSAFKNVLVVGSSGDVYVPVHSSLLETCKPMHKDSTPLGNAVREMLANIRHDLVTSEKKTRFVRYTVFHKLAGVARAHRITGRAAHTAVVDDDLFIEKLIAVSALKYFK
ncbi:unnamed protein product, partial [Mesorhabditis belari]|uniref:DUF676 domain-containing protein n=1 Tax=Mesorhabditis belari TaxID=2138241 RepID=A0AAF3EGA2_9BILA